MKRKNQKRRKTPTLAQHEPVLSKPVREELIRFREFHPVKRFSRNLRSMLIDFLMSDGAEAKYLQDLLYDMQGLFDLLEVMELEDEAQSHYQPEEPPGIKRLFR